MKASSGLVSGRIHSFESLGAVDGPGLRFVVFMQGCRLRCGFCQNPDARPFSGGTAYTADEVMVRILRCRSYIAHGGVTLSGGDPLEQPEFALSLLELCSEAGIHTALDTAAPVPLSVSAPVLDAAALVMLDIKALDDGLCRRISGAGNANALAALDYCERNGKPVWIRHVLVPGLTLKRDLIIELGRFLAGFKCVKRVELLPFHKLGAPKWAKLGLKDPFADIPPATREEAAEAEVWLNGEMPLQNAGLRAPRGLPTGV